MARAAVGQGRCAGCEKVGKLRPLQAHVLSCPGFLALYASDPAHALDPAAEFARWQAGDRQAGKDAARQVTITGNAARRQEQADSFERLPDPVLD